VTTGLTYSQYVTQIATMGAVASETDPNFVTILPSMITYAENRIYRELNFLQTSDSVTGYAIASGARTLTLPEGTFVVSEQINIITPAGEDDPEVGVRVPLLPVTKEYLDAVYGASTYTGQPRYFCPFNDNLFLVGPFADAQYYTEVVGEIRPASLSVSNTTTFISQYLPDLFIMASMIYLSAYQRDFGRQSDDPQMAQSYEAQYQLLKQGAMVEEARKAFEASGWTSQAPPSVASPSRG